MNNLPVLDFCFYCRGFVPDWTFPHICSSCLAVIRSGGEPVTRMKQDSFEEDSS